MEAIIKQTNISANVSINIGVLNDVMQSTKQHVLNAIRHKIGAFTLPRLYRKAIRLEQYIEKAIGDHPVITDAALVLMGIGIIAEIVLFC